MNPLVWLQSLVTFRKSDGSGFQVPALDSSGRIRVTLLDEPTILVQASPPSSTSGDILWADSATGEVYSYDTTRSKWLTLDEVSVFAGRNGTTAVGSFYRGPDGMVLDGSTRGIPVQKGTLTGLAWTRSDSGAATLQVYANGSLLAELASSASGVTSTTTLNVDFDDGLMSFANKLTGNTTSNVSIAATYRRRK